MNTQYQQIFIRLSQCFLGTWIKSNDLLQGAAGDGGPAGHQIIFLGRKCRVNCAVPQNEARDALACQSILFKNKSDFLIEKLINEDRMSGSVRWGSIRPPGSDLPWYYSPNSYTPSRSILRGTDPTPNYTLSPAKQNDEPALPTNKDTWFGASTPATQRRIPRFIASTPNAQSAGTSAGHSSAMSPVRPGTAPRLRFDDLRSREPATTRLSQEMPDSAAAAAQKIAPVVEKKTAFVVAVQVSSVSPVPASSRKPANVRHRKHALFQFPRAANKSARITRPPRPRRRRSTSARSRRCGGSATRSRSRRGTTASARSSCEGVTAPSPPPLPPIAPAAPAWWDPETL